MTFSEGDIRHNNTNVAQGTPIYTSRPETRLEAKQVPKGEYSNTEIHYTTKSLEFNEFKQKSKEYLCKWIFIVQYNGGKNIKLDQSEFIEMGPLSRDFGFNMEA